MKLPRILYWVVGLLLVIAGSLGFIAGQNALPTETAVIEAGADLFAEQTGGARTACVGRPGEGEVWIIVRCDDGVAARTYLFNRQGRLLAFEGGPRA
ncbi:hypothetical protein GQ651_08010 [Alphaproteobacteria bacterium GH1-50]|uniref:Uncharacterized protein n=1 Tax=Kangsaoukella pontilimi TaxID=2691042 RepID=A0A7C9IG33_9RHOB|nr:hypothetical protein [Kangsaoukella pontilimi]MXQ07789.1 hypothetical protein [Kangsaoukella pontilimi]